MTKRILVVDDDATIRLLLHRTLEQLELEGVELHFAEDGRQGLALAQSLRPELMFVDVMMPGIDGVDLCRTIRHDKDLVGVHLIILTARGSRPVMELADGPHEYLTKPFDPDQIVRRAGEVLGLDPGFELPGQLGWAPIR